MRTRYITLAVALTALSLGCGSQKGGSVSLGEVVRVPGTQVKLAPPPGFTLSTSFAGFEKRDLKAAVTIREVAGNYAQLLETMSAKALEPRGMKVLETKEVTADGYDATLLSVTGNSKGIDFDHRMLLVGTDSKALLIVAAHPDPIPADLEQQMVASLLSLVWDPEVPVDLFDGLGFRIPETESVTAMRRIWNGLMMQVAGEHGNVILFISKVPPEIEIADVEEFSIQRLKALPELKELGDIDGQVVVVGALEGYEIVGNAQDAEAGRPIVVYQMVLKSEAASFLIGAIIGAEGSEAYVEKFRAAARTLEVSS